MVRKAEGMSKQVKNEKWEMKLASNRNLRKQSSSLLYDRVKLLVDVYNDMEFRRWCSDNHADELDYMDSEIDDTGIGFLTWMAVLEAHPNQEEWLRQNVRVLAAEAMDADREKKKAAILEDGRKERVEWKARAMTAEAECERLRGEVKALTDRVDELKKIIDSLSGSRRLVLAKE